MLSSCGAALAVVCGSGWTLKLWPARRMGVSLGIVATAARGQPQSESLLRPPLVRLLGHTQALCCQRMITNPVISQSHSGPRRAGCDRAAEMPIQLTLTAGSI